MQYETDTITLAPDKNTSRTVTRWLEQVACRQQWSSDLIFALTLSVDEAITNILSYAFPDDQGPIDDHTKALVSLQCTDQGSQIQIKITDNGLAYDPTQSTVGPLPESVESARIGGHGIRLMRHYLSALTYSRRESLNCLTLIIHKTRPPPS